MSCLGPDYNPVPTHIGSRVENRCVYDTELQTLEEVYIPQLKINIPFTDVGVINNMLIKGNVLQYKKNSSNLTKNQRYSKIATGKWTNRTKNWATQSQTYTNPNTNFLKRTGTTNITLSGYTTTAPVSCNITTYNPNNIIIKDGGIMLCNSIENPCNGYSITFPPPQKCFPTSTSDVPGPIIDLCYNTSLPTYYPRQRYVMASVCNKWPQNAKCLCRSGNKLTSYSCRLCNPK